MRVGETRLKTLRVSEGQRNVLQSTVKLNEPPVSGPPTFCVRVNPVERLLEPNALLAMLVGGLQN